MKRNNEAASFGIALTHACVDTMMGDKERQRGAQPSEEPFRSFPDEFCEDHLKTKLSSNVSRILVEEIHALFFKRDRKGRLGYERRGCGCCSDSGSYKTQGEALAAADLLIDTLEEVKEEIRKYPWP